LLSQIGSSAESSARCGLRIRAENEDAHFCFHLAVGGALVHYEIALPQAIGD
jgi:hypothetical protein